jgi:hypothetical protein
MNRKKKINQTLKAKAKKANAKKAGQPSNKSQYVAKADREKVDLNEDSSVSQITSQTIENISTIEAVETN